MSFTKSDKFGMKGKNFCLWLLKHVALYRRRYERLEIAVCPISAFILYKDQKTSVQKEKAVRTPPLQRICVLIDKKINMNHTTYYVETVCVTEPKYEEQGLKVPYKA